MKLGRAEWKEADHCFHKMLLHFTRPHSALHPAAITLNTGRGEEKSQLSYVLDISSSC